MSLGITLDELCLHRHFLAKKSSGFMRRALKSLPNLCTTASYLHAPASFLHIPAFNLRAPASNLHILHSISAQQLLISTYYIQSPHASPISPHPAFNLRATASFLHTTHSYLRTLAQILHIKHSFLRATALNLHVTHAHLHALAQFLHIPNKWLSHLIPLSTTCIVQQVNLHVLIVFALFSKTLQKKPAQGRFFH